MIGLQGYDGWLHVVLATLCGDALYDIVLDSIRLLQLVHILRATFAGT